MKKTAMRCAALALCLAGPAFVEAAAQDPAALKRLVGQADYYVREFEKEVARQRGGGRMVWRSQKDALDRVQRLKQDHPDDPEVEKLFQRVRAALMKRYNDTDVAPEWTAYKRHEENLRKIIAEEGAKEWENFLARHRDKVIARPYPTPDWTKTAVDDLEGTHVVLEDVEYPAHQFHGATGEYVFSGKPSDGFYFLDISGRAWLGPYEAVKRYRRNVDSGLADVKKWTVLAEIVSITAENPRPSQEGTGNTHFGWIVKPVALYVPGRVMAVYDGEAPSSGRFVGENRVEEIKNGWYTVKSVPADVTPERLAEIFMTAIKEKNYELYRDCIDPERLKGSGEEQLRYHWDLHQERFRGEYVHATFGKATISVRQGFDDANEQENFFLDDKQRATLTKIGGEKVEEAVVESRAFDENGKQIGSPHSRRLIRRGGGRWYVEEYAPRF